MAEYTCGVCGKSWLQYEDGRYYCGEHSPGLVAYHERFQQQQFVRDAERAVLSAAAWWEAVDAEAVNQHWTIASDAGRWGEARRRLQAAVRALREARAG